MVEPRRLLAIDPGNCTGIATFEDEILVHCDVCTPSDPIAHYVGQHVALEIPQVYRSELSKGDPNDLIKLALHCGRLIERFTRNGLSVSVYKPNEWKGQIPKHVHHQRVLKALTDAERKIIPGMASTKKHNMMDAIALGLFVLGRLRR